MYQLTIYEEIMRLNDDKSVNSFIPKNPLNRDYQRFKSDITNGAELLDTDGNPITGDALTTFIGGLA